LLVLLLSVLPWLLWVVALLRLLRVLELPVLLRVLWVLQLPFVLWVLQLLFVLWMLRVQLVYQPLQPGLLLWRFLELPGSRAGPALLVQRMLQLSFLLRLLRQQLHSWTKRVCPDNCARPRDAEVARADAG
jgi:hypothetical protein